jgi:hypothetical protein
MNISVEGEYYNATCNCDEPNKVKGRWFANSSILNEGDNYEVICTGYYDGVFMEGAQYIYMHKPQSFWDTIFSRILTMFNLITEPTVVRLVTKQANFGGDINVIGQVTKGGSLVTNANCSLDVMTINDMSMILSNVTMYNGNSGYYNYSFDGNNEGPYVATIRCMVNDSDGRLQQYIDSDTIFENVPASVDVLQIYEGTPKISLIYGNLYYGVATDQNVLAQLSIGSNVVSNSDCNLTIYYSNMSKITDATMTYTGEAGVYQYTWSPVGIGSYPTRIECRSGSLGTRVVQDMVSLRVEDGVNMYTFS